MATRILPTLCIAVLGAFLCNLATAQFEEVTTVEAKATNALFTGNQLFKYRSHREWMRAYVAGVIDSGEDASPQHSRMRFCLPVGGTLATYADVFVGYLSANPQLRQEQGATLVREALSAAFACKSSSQ